MHQIRYFLAVCETLNFTRAAESCNVSQPSLTRAIKGLEDELGGPLFRRERNNTHLTGLGEMMRPHLTQVLIETDAAKERARSFARLEDVELKLGMMCTIGPRRFVPFLQAFRERHPKVRLVVQDGSNTMLQERLAQGELDVAVLVWFTVERAPPMAQVDMSRAPPVTSWRRHFADPALRAAFATGFVILFAFIGTFTYVNFVLVRPPFSVGMMMLGTVYFVFLPSIVTTPLAGRLVRRIGTRPTMWASFAVAAAGLPLLLGSSFSALLSGLCLVAVGTFFAQATATGFVGRAATTDRGAASGLYLASYFLGGLAGSAVLGPIFDGYGWPACVAGIGAALAAGALLTFRLDVAERTAADTAPASAAPASRIL
jgi:DNA-binding transcriptional LysR family regulator